MKKINIETTVPREELIAVINNHKLVNDKVKFDEKKGKPHVRLKEKGDKVKITCQMVGGANKDNAFLEGTYFTGKITEQNGMTRINGVIVTAPLYHTVIVIMSLFYLFFTLTTGSFTPLPPLLVIFSIILFRPEFEKQGTIERYLLRAVKRAEYKRA